MDDLCVGNHNLWRNHIGVTTTSRGRTIGLGRDSRKGLGPARRGLDRNLDRLPDGLLDTLLDGLLEQALAHSPIGAHSGIVAEPSDTREVHAGSGDGTAPTGPDSHEHQPEETSSGLARFAARAPWRRLPHPLRWLTVAIIGGSCVVAGIAMLVLPGPGIAFILLGLAILATEFVWAETLLHRVKNGSQHAWRAAKSRIKRDNGTTTSTSGASIIEPASQQVRPIPAPQSD